MSKLFKVKYLQNILVPTDFSKKANYALRVAATLCELHGDTLILMHFITLPSSKSFNVKSDSNAPETALFMRLVNQKLDALKNKSYLKNVTVKCHVVINDSLNSINRVIEDYTIDLIVMGSHGANGLKELFIGSTAEKVVRQSTKPVLVIKRKHKSFDIKNFVFASDFKLDNRETYKQAVTLAKLFDAKIHLLFVNTAYNFTSTPEAENRIQNFILSSSFDNLSVTIFNDYSVEQGIINFSNLNHIDLIGISTHGRQGIAHFFNSSISEDVVNHAKRPVITFKI